MEFEKIIKERYSVRKFIDKEVEDEKIDKLLETARLAPTAKDYQPQKIYILKSKESLEKINGLCRCIYGAPLVMMISFDKNISWKNPFTNEEQGLVDATIIATSMMYRATDLGLGCCYVGYFNRHEVEKEFNHPKNEEVACLLVMGYPDPNGPISPMHYQRKEVKEYVKVL